MRVRGPARRKRGFKTLALALGLSLASAGLATAAAPPLGDNQVSITAREQPLGSFLQALFSQAGLTAVISPALTGNVNGAFSGRADKVFGDISKAYNLLTYYDGVSVYVYAPSEAGARTFPASPQLAQRVQRSASGMVDGQNRLRSGNQVLIATGSRRFLDQVEELSRSEAAAPASYMGGGGLVGGPAPVEYRVYYLRYAWAEDVNISSGNQRVNIPGVATILRSLMVNNVNQPVPIAQRTETQLPSTVPGLRGQGLAGQGRVANAGTLGFSPAGGPMPDPYAADAWQNVANQGGFQQQQALPDSVRVQADSRLNAVIVRDTRERLNAYEQLIRALDVEPQLLEIEATIIDVNIDKVRDLGFNFRFQDENGRNQLLFGNGSFTDLLLQPDSLITPSARGFALSTVLRDGASLTSRLTALETKGVVKVVQRPQVLTLSNVEAVFDNSRNFYVKLEGERDVDLFNVQSGTTLKVTPHVTRDQGQTRIRMLVAIEDGAITDRRVDNLPVVERSALTTQALIVEGQSLLLGGMTVQSDIKSVDQAPILGDIPIVGNLFKTTHKSSSRTERLFLITPRLASLSGPPALSPDASALMGPVAPPPPPPQPPAAQPSARPK